MKKILAILLAAAMVFSMAACSEKKDTKTDTTPTQTETPENTASSGNIQTTPNNSEAVASSGNLTTTDNTAEFLCGGDWVLLDGDSSVVLHFEKGGKTGDGNGWDYGNGSLLIFDSSYKKLDSYKVVSEFGTTILERDNSKYGSNLGQYEGALVRADAKDAAVKEYKAK